MAGKRSQRTVTAPLVVVKLDDGTTRYLSHGDALPDEASKESVDNLSDLGYLSDGDNDK